MTEMKDNYSISRISLHWIIAIAIIALFFSGEWMVGLDYYHEWYTKAPYLHKSIGLILLLVIILASILRVLTNKPKHSSSLSRFETRTALVVQISMSLLTYAVIITGYLIVTAKGEAVSVFNWFEIPALFPELNFKNDWVGKLHNWGAHLIMGLACLHALAALFHHFVKKDSTLKRMLNRNV